ncbi:hypothetical protein [Paenibacillus endoradicis]|uniref:hypothetical protein n=1 Tax=Paenibacillus endoradicis TaxID=2972487 RepID=UPI0021595071|nr:hypothetical protein [Paenibacillus endoradicis]MCR8658793.1 hypothetical protein [Paenibacillus endoradicis]
MKPKMRNLLVLLLVLSITYNFYMLYDNKHSIKQEQRRNQSGLGFISILGKNIAGRLEEFLDHSHEVGNEEAREILFNSWRIVQGESRSISTELTIMSPRYMGDLAPKWSLLQYSLIRIDQFLYGLDLKFLEQRSYSINDEETEKLKAVITVYTKINEEVNKETENSVLVIDSLTEQMKIIDEYYATTLESINQD